MKLFVARDSIHNESIALDAPRFLRGDSFVITMRFAIFLENLLVMIFFKIDVYNNVWRNLR